jgi:hypothetical protein
MARCRGRATEGEQAYTQLVTHAHGTQTQHTQGNLGARRTLKAKMEDMEEIDRQLAAEGTMAGADSMHAISPDEEMMRAEDGEDAAADALAIERQTLKKLLPFFFKHGCTPSNVFQQVIFLTKIISPEILRSFGKESFAELGKCLNLTRAAMSANYKTRIVKMVEVSERRSGRATPTFKAPFQKSAAAAARMAAAQKGNINRKKK